MAEPPGPGPVDNAPAPTCFRHPGRETYVSCVRCGRPACPDCLRSAAVGQQCVECIRQANRGTRQVTGVFGGRATSRPVVTWTLVGLNVLAYLAELLYPKTVDYGQMVGGAFDPKLGELVGVAVGDWYRLITSAFLHEPLGTGIGSSVLYYYFADPRSEALGASGAIFGLFGAWFVLSRRLRLDSRMVVGLIVINLVITFVVPGIAWQAHVGGLIAGTALTAAFVYAPPKNRNLVQVAAVALLIAVLVAGLVIRDQHLAGAVIFRV